MAKTTPIDEALAAYLVGWGVLNKGELGRVNKSNETVEIAQEAWDLFQRGQAVSTLLVRLDVAENKNSSLKFSITTGKDAESVFSNWDQIDEYLQKQHRIALSKKDLAMICSKVKSPVEEVLSKLRNRTAELSPPATLEQLDADGDGKVDAPQAAQAETGDTKDQVMALVATVSSAYKILLSTLLLVFTPQTCGLRTCSLRENLDKANVIARPAIIINFATLFVFVIGETIVFLRERFVITYFTSEDDLPDNNLEEEINLYPKLKSKLATWTRTCYGVATVMLLLLLGNFGYSVWVLRVKAGASLGLIIQVIANVLLVSGKTWGYISASRAALAKPGAVVSLTLVEPKESNAIDPEFRGKDGFFVDPPSDPDVVAVK